MKKTKRILLLSIFLILYSCDPGWILTLKDTSEKDYIEIGSIKAEISLYSLANIQLSTKIKLFYPDTLKNLIVNKDSLKILFNNLSIPYELYNPNAVVSLDPEHIILYSFYLDAFKVRKGDTISICATKFIGIGNMYYDLDTVIFHVPEEL